MKKFMTLILSTVILYSCGSTIKEKMVKDQDHSKEIKIDYKVVDSLTKGTRPGWVIDANVWAKQNKMDVEKFRYFSFETEPKVKREIACSLAKARARADIAAEITTFIQKTLAESTEGKAAIDEKNPNSAGLRDFVEDTLAERIQGLITGSSVEQTYWEKRKYMKEMGAENDFTGYTCAAFISIDKSKLERAIERAAAMVEEKAHPEVKENVKKALNQINEDFNKLKI